MKCRHLLFTCLFLTLSNQAHATLIIDIKAFIDESTVLVLKDNTIQWQHFDHATVGRHNGVNEPTIITIKQDCHVIWDDYVWYPVWPEPVPAEIRYPAVSSFLITPIDLNPFFPSYSSITIIDSRFETTIVKQPTPEDEAVRIYFNDPPPGPEWYHSIITIDEGNWVAFQISAETYSPLLGPTPDPSPVPEPALITLLMVGFIPGLFFLRRYR